MLRRANDTDALRGDKDSLFDERRPLVLTVDDYYLFPGRTSGEGSWTITIGRNRALPGRGGNGRGGEDDRLADRGDVATNVCVDKSRQPLGRGTHWKFRQQWMMGVMR